MTRTQVKAFAWTDLGKKREKNEDSYLMLPKQQVYAVADGMGGHAGGKQASELAVRVIERWVTEHQEELKSKQASEYFFQALKTASKDIQREAVLHPELSGMGTTTTALMFQGKEAILAHVGDSRAYLIRRSKIKQISEDHSLVQEQYKAGLISAEQAKTSRFRNIITRSIGLGENIEVDQLNIKTQSGDIFLLCTDGLTTLVEDHEIEKIVSQNSRKNIGNQLIELANSRGGYDNITVILIYV